LDGKKCVEKCEHPKFLWVDQLTGEKSCETSCPPGYYKDHADRTCKKCKKSCKTCSSADKCDFPCQ